MNYTKLPMSSNKDICENNLVAEEWRNLNRERRKLYSSSIRSLFVLGQVQVSPVGSNLEKDDEAGTRSSCINPLDSRINEVKNE